MTRMTLSNGDYLQMQGNGHVIEYRKGGIARTEHYFPEATTKKATLACMRELRNVLNRRIVKEAAAKEPGTKSLGSLFRF